MAILSGFEYDIFISYRHNDNRSGWVTEFVKALQEELAATIKEPVSVYFDTNPHDGLLETHNVDKSLEGKLKSLIFIPILSQTYCDPKSFAWQHEFVAFNKLAKEDQFGRDIRLNNGNVASRILPIKIHDLDAEDKTAIESEIGGVVRAIDFIYKEPGVNRPLLSSDSLDKNLNKTIYRNQVNKVANAVKEIVHAIRIGKTEKLPLSTELKSEEKKSKSFWVGATGVIFLALLLVYWLAPKLRTESPSQAIASKKKSIAVLAFKDISPARNQSWLSEGLSEEILNSLADLPELVVPGRSTSFFFADKSMELKEIAEKLHVEYLLDGSVMLIDGNLKVSVSLIRADDGNQIWSDQVNTKMDDAFKIMTGIATNVAQQLEVVLDDAKRESLKTVGTKNIKAFEYFLRGKKIDNDFHGGKTKGNLWEAKKWYDKALEEDSTLYAVHLYRFDAYNHFLRYNMPGPQQGKLSVEEAEHQFLKNLNYAEMHCKNPYDRLVATFNKKMYSSDWKGLRALAELLMQEDPTKANLPFAHVYAFWIFIEGKRNEAVALIEAQAQSDPLDYFTKSSLFGIYLANGYYAKVESLYDELRANQGDTLRFKLYLHLAQFFQGQAIQSIDVEDFLVSWENGNNKRANEYFARLDKKNPYLVWELITFMGFYTPFELAATPNFVKQMKEAGIDPEKVFRPMPHFSTQVK